MEEVVVAGAVEIGSIGVLVSIAALVVNVLVVVVGGAWKLGRVELALRDAITESKREVEDRLDKNSREFGEVAAALRAKIAEVELYTRDNFVRRDAYISAYAETRTDIRHVELAIVELTKAVAALVVKTDKT